MSDARISLDQVRKRGALSADETTELLRGLISNTLNDVADSVLEDGDSAWIVKVGGHTHFVSVSR